MKLQIHLFLFFFCYIYSVGNTFTQELRLNITSTNKKDINILSKLDYQKKHKDTLTLYSEIQKISEQLKSNGFLANTLQSIKRNQNYYTAYFSLNTKIDLAVLKISAEHYYLFENLRSDTIEIPLKEVQNTLSQISKKLDSKGLSFSKVKLVEINIRNKRLYADLSIIESKKRLVDKVIVKGYNNFPISYLKNYFKITNNSVFNQKNINQISNNIQNLEFIEQIKPPEILFTKDSTLVYLYVKKKQNSSFDGIVNFATKENGELLFNGNIDLRLNNILNKGENFTLFWNSIAEERQEFKLSSKIPYIFNSKFTPEISFSIYKQDSSFINTKLNTELFYDLSNKAKITINYNSESSNKLEETLNNDIVSFTSQFIGVSFQYLIKNNDIFKDNKFYFKINPELGKRTTNNNSSDQFKIQAKLAYLWNLNFRNSIFIKNTTGYLNSNNYLNNELFRIGGANSIRGFQEQSIFTNNFTYFNTEYRYFTSKRSYIHTISDIGLAEKNTSNNLFYGLGLGYVILRKESLISISSAISNSNQNNLSFKNNQLIIKWVSYF